MGQNIAQDKSAVMCAKPMEKGRITFIHKAFILKWELFKYTQNMPPENSTLQTGRILQANQSNFLFPL